MFKKILVALDHSPSAQQLFKTSLELAQKHQAQMMLLHVLTSEEEGSPIPIPSGADEMYWASGLDFNYDLWKQQWKDYESKCLEQIRALASEANRSDVSTEFRQIPGHAGRVICKFAQSWGADVIIIGNRGYSGLKEWMIGSVSNYVLHHARCHVLTVKSHSE